MMPATMSSRDVPSRVSRLANAVGLTPHPRHRHRPFVTPHPSHSSSAQLTTPSHARTPPTSSSRRALQAERASVGYEDGCKDFRVAGAGAQFTQQFANLYFTRLGELRPDVEKSVRRKWGADALQQR
eukprot:3949122-Prymnesium_polylepis.1